MIAVLSNGSQTLIAHVGDGCAVVQDASSGTWRVPLWPDHGEYASTTTFVTDDPEAKCRILRDEGDLSAIAVLTDGLERIAVDFARLQPFAGFFDGMARPVATSTAEGRDYELSAMLKEYLDGETICSRTDDDKTLVVASRR
jgi:hypothetical protein